MFVVLFFTMAFCVFLASMTLTGVTFYQWYKTAKAKKQLPANENPQP